MVIVCPFVCILYYVCFVVNGGYMVGIGNREYILGYIFGYILRWYTVRQRQDKPHSVHTVVYIRNPLSCLLFSFCCLFTPSCHNTVFIHIRYYIHPSRPLSCLISSYIPYIVYAATMPAGTSRLYCRRSTPGGASVTPAEELPPSKISLPNCPPNTPLLCLNLSPISVLVVQMTAYPSNVHSLTQLFTPYTPFYQFPICSAPYPTLSYFCFIFDALLRHFCFIYASFLLQKRPKMLHFWRTNVPVNMV